MSLSKGLMTSSSDSVVKNPPTNAGDTGLTPGSGRFPGEGDGNPLQYSCLGNPMDRGAWRVHGVARVRHNLATKREQHKLLINMVVVQGW